MTGGRFSIRKTRRKTGVFRAGFRTETDAKSAADFATAEARA
jgi:hypothetical protein